MQLDFRNGALRDFTIIGGLGCLVLGAAYGLVTSAMANQIGIELLIIIGLVAPALTLPAIAFRAHARECERVEAESRVRNSYLNLVLEHMSQGFCMFDADQRLTLYNTQYADLYGVPSAQLKPGTPLTEILESRVANGVFAGDSPQAYIRERLERVAEGRFMRDIHELSDGRVLAVRHTPLPCGGWLTTHDDITDFRKIEKKIAYMARFDPLTDLPNRAQFREKVETELRSSRGDRNFAVLCLDLDNFKSINDTLGHPAGDKLLKEVGDRLLGCAADGDTVARLGGDEFAIIQTAPNQPEQARSLASLICAIMKEPFEIDGDQADTGISIGIAVAPDDGADADQVIRNADIALHRAKEDDRGGYRFFESGLDARMRDRRELELEMRNAIKQGQFELWYQPLYDTRTEQLSGFEALLRWPHPERGMISPAEFIPVAEETGLIGTIGESVLRQACADAARWPQPVRIAVNISAYQFKSGSLVTTVVNALSRSGLPAERLELEITESALLDDNESTVATLHMLRQLGVRIAMDDFGTGYSSLSYLRSFPFDKIKIDSSFVRDLSTGDDVRAIVRAVASLGAALGMSTVAEGVETEEQLKVVRDEGYTEIQGFYYSPPCPGREIAGRFFRTPRLVAAAGA